MAYSDSIKRLKEMLDGYSAESGRLTELYKTALQNAEKTRADAQKAIDEQYYRDRNEVYSDIARSERNTLNALSARGLGFSGETAQARLNSNVLLSERLGDIARGRLGKEIELDNELAKQKSELALDAAERQSALDKSYAGIAADIAKTELDAEQEKARLKAEKEMQQAELNAKYGGNVSGGNVSGGNINVGGNGGGNGELDDIIGFNPEATPKELAKLLVTSATDDGYIRGSYDEYLINRYMLELYDNYTLPDGYMDELIFMLKAYGYPAKSREDMRKQVITRDAKAYYEDRYKSAFDSAVLSGNHELSATLTAGKTARSEVLEYIYSRAESEQEFLDIATGAGVPKADATEFYKTKSQSDIKPDESEKTQFGGGNKHIYSSLK